MDVVNYKVIKVPSVYPIYRKDYEIHLQETQECFDKIKNYICDYILEEMLFI